MAWLAVVFFILVTRRILLLRRFVTKTSLRQAWIWLVLCLPAMALTIIAQMFHTQVPPGWLNATEWLAGVLLMAPPVAVLGARRPGTRAWPWFVVLPLIIVLLWPACSELISNHGKEALTASTPALLGFLIAGLMGFGNYFGTRNTLAAALYFVAPAALLMHVAGAGSSITGTSLISVAALWVSFELSTNRYYALESIERSTARNSANRLWYLFRDFLGIVWAKRVMDRMNLFAQRENWKLELTLDGFAPRQDCKELSPDDFRRPIETLAWLLRRFADEDWIEQQLQPHYSRSQSESVDV